MRFSKEKLQIWCSAITGGALVAYLFVPRLTPSFVLIFLLTTFSIAVTVHVIIRLMVRLPQESPLFAQMKQFEEEIKRLPLSVVKARAEKMLEDESKFACVKARQPAPDSIASLGKDLTELFRKYEAIKTQRGEDVLSWKEVGKSNYHPGYVRIGRDVDDCIEFVVKPGEDSVFEVAGYEETDSDFEKVRFPTIYHWILWTGQSETKTGNENR